MKLAEQIKAREALVYAKGRELRAALKTFDFYGDYETRTRQKKERERFLQLSAELRRLVHGLRNMEREAAKQ